MAEESGWVIELDSSPASEPSYWTGKDWSENHMMAIRFARRIDAQRVHYHLLPAIDVRICEHAWDA